MSKHELSKLQEAELDIFKEFIRICQENHLRYFICGGSFLGAIRHKGFIPWDDDIDVAMPRPDFEIFLQIAPRLLPEDLYLSTYKLGAEHITLVAMIINKHKDFVLNNAAKQVRTGAWVDILVIDGAPEPGLKRKAFGIVYMYHRMMNQFAHFDEIVNLNKARPWYENLAIQFARISKIEKHLDPVRVGERFHKFLQANPYDTSRYVATFMGATKMNEILPREIYGEGTDYEFEGLSVKGPDRYNAYLSHFYGSYMTLPPLNERNRHNVTVNKGGARTNPCIFISFPFAYYPADGRCA